MMDYYCYVLAQAISDNGIAGWVVQEYICDKDAKDMAHVLNSIVDKYDLNYNQSARELSQITMRALFPDNIEQEKSINWSISYYVYDEPCDYYI